jgi:hypothetical protein
MKGALIIKEILVCGRGRALSLRIEAGKMGGGPSRRGRFAANVAERPVFRLSLPRE